MSTQINVTVGKAGLTDQAKRQTAANRQAKLEADARIKAAAEGQRRRDAARLIRGIDADGKLLFGTSTPATLRRDEPAANLRSRPTEVAWGWLSRRLTDQPTYFPSVLGGGLRYQTRSSIRYALTAGSGSARQTYEIDYDIRSYFSSPVGVGPDPNGTFPGITLVPGTPSVERLAAVPQDPAPGYDTSISKSYSRTLLLPAGKDTMVYYHYSLRLEAVQTVNKTIWSGTAGDGTPREVISYWSWSTPALEAFEAHQCYLVTNASIKILTVPPALQSIVRGTVPTWSIAAAPISLGTGGAFSQVVSDDPGPNGFTWQYTAPSGGKSFAALVEGRLNGYDYEPLGGAIYVTDMIATGGIYETLLGLADINYQAVADRAGTLRPDVSDPSGFGYAVWPAANSQSAVTTAWSSVYDQAMTLKHTHEGSPYRKPRLYKLAENRLPRLSDSLTYTTIEGFTETALWEQSALIGYDYASAAYCRQHLLGIGFTNADLNQ